MPIPSPTPSIPARRALAFGGIRATLAVLAAVLTALFLTPAPARALQPRQVVSIEVVPQREAAHPGDQFALAVIITLEDTWHIWPNQPVVPPALEGVDATPTTLSLPAPPAPGIAVKLDWTQWPTPVPVASAAFGESLEILSLKGRSVAYVPVVLAPDLAPGDYPIRLDLFSQACDDSVCLPPGAASATATLRVVPRDQPIREAGADLFAGFVPSVFARILAGDAAPGAAAAEPAPIVFNLLGWTFTLPRASIALILGLAFVAGLIMNFTPCVLPVIPIKVLSLQHHAQSPAKLAYFGTIYCIGIVAAYAVLGLLAAGLITGGQKFEWGQIFTYRWFTILMGLLVGVMALGMIGLFTLRLPQAVYMINPSGDTAPGNFLLGLLTAVLAVPCTGPLLGGALAWAGTQPPAISLLAFLSMGLGMASPYALLIAFPKLIDRIPRGGAGGELLKQVVGVLMLAVAAYLLSLVTIDKWPWWIVGAITAAAFAWLAVGAWRLLKSPRAKWTNTAVAVVAIPLTFLGASSLASEGPVAWRLFHNQTDDAIRAAIAAELAEGRVVLVDFTAKWCTNCHVIEKSIILSETGLLALGAPDVVEFKVDLSSAADDQGWGLVKEISGAGGIPLIAIYGPALPEGKPIYYQSFFKPSDLAAAIDKARGTPAAPASSR